MSLLNDAAAIYVGSTAAVAVYVGSVKVWPTASPLPANIAHAQDDGTDMMIWDQYKEALRSGSPWILQIVCSPLFRSKSGPCRVIDAAGTQIGVDPYGSDPVGPDVTVEQWIAAADAGWARLTHTGVGWSFYLDWEGRT